MLKQLFTIMVLSVALVACGGGNSSKKKSSSSAAASVAPSSVAASVAPSSMAASSVAASVAPSSEAASSEAASSEAASSEAASSEAASSEAASSEAASSEAASSEASVADCEDWETLLTCDATDGAGWSVDGGNGGAITQGEFGPIFTNGEPTGTNSWNAPGMFFTYNEVGQAVSGKTLTLTVDISQEILDSGGYMQVFMQENGHDYQGKYCDIQYADLVAGENTLICLQSGANPADGIDSLRLGFQLKGTTTYTGTIEVTYATWE